MAEERLAVLKGRAYAGPGTAPATGEWMAAFVGGYYLHAEDPGGIDRTADIDSVLPTLTTGATIRITRDGQDVLTFQTDNGNAYWYTPAVLVLPLKNGAGIIGTEPCDWHLTQGA